MAEDSTHGKKRTARSAVLDTRPEYERFGAWMRAQREAAGLQQRPISRLLGKPEQFINKVEHGKQRIDVVEFLDFCQALGIEPATTLGELLAATKRTSAS